MVTDRTIMAVEDEGKAHRNHQSSMDYDVMDYQKPSKEYDDINYHQPSKEYDDMDFVVTEEPLKRIKKEKTMETVLRSPIRSKHR